MISLIYQLRKLRRVDFHLILPSLPMRRENHHSPRLHFRSDLFADFLEFLVCWVVMLVHDIGLLVVLSVYFHRNTSYTYPNEVEIKASRENSLLHDSKNKPESFPYSY